MVMGRCSPSPKYSHQLRVMYSRPRVHCCNQNRLSHDKKEIYKFTVLWHNIFILFQVKGQGESSRSAKVIQWTRMTKLYHPFKVAVVSSTSGSQMVERHGRVYQCENSSTWPHLTAGELWKQSSAVCSGKKEGIFVSSLMPLPHALYKFLPQENKIYYINSYHGLWDCHKHSYL